MVGEDEEEGGGKEEDIDMKRGMHVLLSRFAPR